MPERKDPFIERVPEDDRTVESGELSYEAAQAAARLRQIDRDAEAARSAVTPEAVAAGKTWREVLEETLAEEPRVNGEEYYAALARFVKGEGEKE